MVRRVAVGAVASWLRAALARPAGCRRQRGGRPRRGGGGDGGMSAEGPTVSVITIFLDEEDRRATPQPSNVPPHPCPGVAEGAARRGRLI